MYIDAWFEGTAVTVVGRNNFFVDVVFEIIELYMSYAHANLIDWSLLLTFLQQKKYTQQV